MRLYVYILLLFLPGRLVQSSYAHTKLELLQQHIYQNQVYSKHLNSDSILLWSEAIEPLLFESGRYDELFEIKYMVIQTHAARGDIGLAVDKVRLMLQTARQLNYPFGMSLAIQCIGNTYMYSTLLTEAVQSYKESWDMMNRYPQYTLFRKTLAVRLIQALFYQGKIEEASHYLTSFNQLLPENETDDPFYIFRTGLNAYYWLHNENLTEAKKQIERGLQLTGDNNNRAIPYLYYVAALYHEKRREYHLALEYYNKISDTLNSGSLVVGHNMILMDNARLLVKMGMGKEACLMYEQVSNIKDSLSATSYIRQVNRLHADYRINAIELLNEKNKNELVSASIIVGGGLLLMALLLVSYIRRGNRRLARSKTILERAKVQTESSVRSKSMFLSNMSHEIRTPLNALSGFSAILAEETIDQETRLQCTEIIQQNSELLLKLINDVIDLSSLEFGKMQFNFKSCEAVALCRNVVEMVQKIKQTNAGIQFDTNLETCMIETDDARWQQVLINLLINATKFTANGTITLSLSQYNDEMALFAVTDTGCGIPEEKRAKIFDRFEKLDEQHNGTGLGLSICQLIIRHIGGKIWIDPEYRTGTRFCFIHPIRQRQEAGKS